MKNKSLLNLLSGLALLILSTSVLHAQEKCASFKLWQERTQKDPNALARKQQLETQTQQWIAAHQGLKLSDTIIRIPVVVHVVYNAAAENVSDAQILSQIDVLNADFTLQNSDSLPLGHAFWTNSANCQIEFCLASIDENGDATTGITRTNTSNTNFTGNGDVKFSSSNGKDNWDPAQFMNMWVCNLDGDPGTLGYATFPSDLAAWPNDDGIVIDYRAFGTTGTAGTGGFTFNNLGRTATHEVGHWLNLSHIWGDATCGDDLVADTPPQEQDNSFCPTFPHNANNTCGSDTNGEMYMNYMDYVDDNCMSMFTFGQKNRMRAVLEGTRTALSTSIGSCAAITGITHKPHAYSVQLYPNPTNGKFNLQLGSRHAAAGINIVVRNVLGAVVYSNSHISQGQQNMEIDLSNAEAGVYFVSVSSDNSKSSHLRLILTK